MSEVIIEPKRDVLTLAPGVEMAFRLIPADAFRMGSRGYYADAEPIHLIGIAEPFWMTETPVTQAQFALRTSAEKIKHKNHYEGRPGHPAESMDWRQVVAFCDWLTRSKGAAFPAGFDLACLPTEAEWEYACRAGTDTEYYTGDGEAALAEAGWFGEEFGKGSTHPVRQKKPNFFGLYDMHGNVWEWCHDEWDASAYRKRVDGDVDPGSMQRLRDWEAGLAEMMKSDQTRVLRGGSWCGTAWNCRSAFRFGLRPDVRFRFDGFRVCLVRGPAAERGAPSDSNSEAEPAQGDRGRGTRPESDGEGEASSEVPDLASAKLPRAAG